MKSCWVTSGGPILDKTALLAQKQKKKKSELMSAASVPVKRKKK
jgi:hypothetical protein